MTLRFGSLFSGIGGIDLALERAGWECAWQVEVDEACRDVLGRHWPGVRRHADIRDLRGADLEPVDVVAGGWPCQDVSVAGARAGYRGTRSSLWWEFARLVAELRPRWVLGENVPGLLSSHGGRDFAATVGSLVELGYGVCWRVLDARHFGVPQRRRRVFLVGHLGDERAAEAVLLEPEGGGGDPAAGAAAGEIASALTRNGVGSGGGADDHAVRRYDGDSEDFVAFHLTQDPISNSEFTPAMGTGTTQGYPTIAVATDFAVRRLTPTECERLQGLPDGWTDGQPDSTRYRQIGNAVAVPVLAWIGRRIAATDSTSDHRA